MRKVDLIRKNMVQSVKNERNILAMANNPFVVGATAVKAGLAVGGPQGGRGCTRGAHCGLTPARIPAALARSLGRRGGPGMMLVLVSGCRPMCGTPSLLGTPPQVRFYYSFTSRDNLYIVMEYLNGGDCYSLLRNLGALDEGVARQYVAEAVLALEYCHTQVEPTQPGLGGLANAGGDGPAPPGRGVRRQNGRHALFFNPVCARLFLPERRASFTVISSPTTCSSPPTATSSSPTLVGSYAPVAGVSHITGDCCQACCSVARMCAMQPTSTALLSLYATWEELRTPPPACRPVLLRPD